MRIGMTVLLCAMVGLTACSPASYTAVVENGNGKSPVVRVDRSGKPYLRVSNLPSGMAPEDTGKFLVRSLELLQKKGLSEGIADVPVIQGSGYYPLFFKMARQETLGLKNDVLRMGLIQLAWADLVSLSQTDDTLASFRESEAYTYVRIPEISVLLKNYSMEPKEAGQLYDYMNAYLLKEVLFVSLQEFTDRPARYFKENDLETPFAQVVIIPECAAFAGFMNARIGNARVLKLAARPFKLETWKSIAGEAVNESEAAFTHAIETKSWTGLYRNPEMTLELDRWLSVYHRMTKPTLFRK